MVFEYALEPELVATWANRHDFRYFVEKFGLGQPRIVSQYPRRWTRMVWDAFRSHDDIERKRMEELLMRLSETMVRRRGYLWEGGRTWLGNAQSENGRRAFHAIVARSNPNNHHGTLVADEIDESTPRWTVPRSLVVARSARGMAEAIAPMLRIAEIVILVDPHFGPERPRYRRPFEAFLGAVVNGRAIELPRRVEVHTSLVSTGTRNFFENECYRQLSACVPTSLTVAILRLSERPGGERHHNRYVLTDKGGVIFGVGLDDGDDGVTDDLALMDREQYELRWSQHGRNPMGFDCPEGAIEIRRNE
jgi:hypothetical protein